MKTSARCSRRRFLNVLTSVAVCSVGTHLSAAENKLAFVPAGNEFHFDTGVLRGTLRGNGRSMGLLPVVDCASGASLTKSLGLFSHYRLLDDTARYGKAAWDWPSEARVLSDGGLEVRWSADEVRPLDMMATYRWSAPNALDLMTRVTAKKDMRKFEVFLASYFDGFPTTVVYSKDPQADKPAFVGPGTGTWHFFPRDQEAIRIAQDGRWKRPPNPVEWIINPKLVAPLAVRRDLSRGLSAVLMTRLQDCFGIALPCDEEGHRSVYFSLFGHDFKTGQSDTAHSRLIIDKNIADESAVSLYASFLKQYK